MALLDPAPTAPVARVADAQNPAAVAYATQRLHQLLAAGLLAGMPKGGDLTAIWRGLSGTLAGPAQQAGYGTDSGAFLRAAAAGVDGGEPIRQGLHGPVIQQDPIQRAVHAAVVQHIADAQQLPNFQVHPLTTAIVQTLMQAPRTPYLGRH